MFISNEGGGVGGGLRFNFFLGNCDLCRLLIIFVTCSSSDPDQDRHNVDSYLEIRIVSDIEIRTDIMSVLI